MIPPPTQVVVSWSSVFVGPVAALAVLTQRLRDFCPDPEDQLFWAVFGRLHANVAIFATAERSFAAAHGGFAAAHGGFAAAHGGFAAAHGGFVAAHGGFAAADGGFAAAHRGFAAAHGGFAAEFGDLAVARGGLAVGEPSLTVGLLTRRGSIHPLTQMVLTVQQPTKALLEVALPYGRASEMAEDSSSIEVSDQ